MLNITKKWLRNLIIQGSLPASTLSKSAKPEVENLSALGFIERKKSGSGSRYYVCDIQAIKNTISATSYDGDLSNLTAKSKAVALHGDAHRGRDDSILLQLSATHKNTIWKNSTNKLNVHEYSSQFGVASLVVKPGDNWSTNMPIMLVENLDLLIYAKDYFVKTGIEGTVLFYSGNIAGKLLQWLGEKSRAPSYIMFPDYDIVGLNNYIRARNKLGDILSLYVPSNLPTLLSMYGDKEKLGNTQAYRTAINETQYQDVVDVFNLNP